MPKFELKKFHENRGHEGMGYDCELWMDGKLAAHCNNEGGGGPDMYHFVSKDMERKVMAHIATLPPYRWEATEFTEAHDSPMNMDIFMMELICEFQANKAFKRQCKTKTLFRLKGDAADEYHLSKQVFTPKIAEGIRKHYGDQLLEIINERFL